VTTDIESTSLVSITAATRMLAECRTLEDVAQIHDMAMAARVYAKEHKLGLEARKHAGTIAVEADIRRGEILKDMAEQGERRYGGDESSKSVLSLPTLADLNTTKKESADAQALAAEAVAVRDWMATAKDVPPKRAARVARDAKAARRRNEKPIPALPATCDLRHGDFRIVLADVPDGSVDVILTDPPYPAKFLPLWSDLAIFAKRVLKPSGMLVAMSGQANLPDVIIRLGQHLSYRWTIAYLMAGGANVVHARSVSTMWKPVLVYGSSERRLFDVVRSESADKTHHDWGQSETGMAELLRLVAGPNAIICDPFVGGGTTALVAMAAGCSFIGAELDLGTYHKARERLAA